MAVFKKVFLITIMIICISFSFCYAIDENQLSSGGSQQTTDGSSQIQIGEGTQAPEENTQLENSSNDYVNENTFAEENQNQNQDSMSTSTETSTSEAPTSTRVSNVSSESKSSTITNILNIALLVVGVLLVFLAIAILIKLNS